MTGEKLRTEQRDFVKDEPLKVRAKRSFARRRKGPADDFHKSLMQERIQSHDALYVKCTEPRNSRTGPVLTLNSGKGFSLGSVLNQGSQPEARNPMKHFEHGLNYTVSPRYLKVSVPKSEEDSGKSSEEDIDELICSQIAEAFEDDMFAQNRVFDNRWESESQGPDTDDSLSIRKEISKSSTQKNATALTSPVSHGSENVDNAGLRFQLKQETWKLKSEVLCDTDDACGNDRRTFFGSCLPGVDSTKKFSNGNNGGKYWTTNNDMQIKWVSEKINRGLQTVKRFSFEPNGSKCKPLSSRVKRICSEDGFQAKRLEILIQDKFSKAPPLVQKVNINSRAPTFSHSELSEYMESVRKSRSGYQTSALELLEDTTFKSALLAAKEKSEKIWLQCENSEFFLK